MAAVLIHAMFPCYTCALSFQDANARAVHLKSAHIEKGYPCHLCSMSFDEQAHVDAHVEILHGTRARVNLWERVDCRLCGGNFRSQAAFGEHLAYDHNLAVEGGHRRCHVEGCRFTNACDFAFTMHRYHVHHQLAKSDWIRLGRDKQEKKRSRDDNMSRATKRAKITPKNVVDLTDDAAPGPSIAAPARSENHPPVDKVAPLGEAEEHEQANPTFSPSSAALLAQQALALREYQTSTGIHYDAENLARKTKKSRHAAKMARWRESEQRRRDSSLRAFQPSPQQQAQQAEANRQAAEERHQKKLESQRKWRAKKQAEKEAAAQEKGQPAPTNTAGTKRKRTITAGEPTQAASSSSSVTAASSSATSEPESLEDLGDWVERNVPVYTFADGSVPMLEGERGQAQTGLTLDFDTPLGERADLFGASDSLAGNGEQARSSAAVKPLPAWARGLALPGSVNRAAQIPAETNSALDFDSPVGEDDDLFGEDANDSLFGDGEEVVSSVEELPTPAWTGCLALPRFAKKA